MGLLGWIVIGLVAGSIAQRVAGVEKRGCLFTLLVGVLGAMVGGYLYNAVSDQEHTIDAYRQGVTADSYFHEGRDALGRAGVTTEIASTSESVVRPASSAAM